MNKKIQLFLITIIGLVIAWVDYFVYFGWKWIFEHNYYCIGTYDGTGQICRIWFEVNPLPLYIITGLAIGFTIWYIYKIFILVLQYFGAIKA